MFDTIKKQIQEETEKEFKKEEKEDIILSFLKVGHRFKKEYPLYVNPASNLNVTVTLRSINDGELEILNNRLQELSQLGARTKTRFYANSVNAQEVEVLSHIDGDRATKRAYLAMYLDKLGTEQIPDEIPTPDGPRKLSLSEREKYLKGLQPSMLDVIYEQMLYKFLSLVSSALAELSVFKHPAG